jgi:hypothetical protein
MADFTTFKLMRAKHYPEKGHGRSTVQGAIGDFRLASKVLGILDGRNHPFNREEGG